MFFSEKDNLIDRESQRRQWRIRINDANTVEIGNVSYVENDKYLTGAIYCRKVLGVMILILQWEKDENRIVTVGDYTVGGRMFNAKVEGEPEKYFNVPESVLKACDHADFFVAIQNYNSDVHPDA